MAHLPCTLKINGGGREDYWSEGATAELIDAWGERYLKLRRGNLKQKHWKEVADIVSSREDYKKATKTDIQCKNRNDTVKKKNKLEKAKIAAGGGPSKWPFFKRLDHKVPTGIPVGIHSGGASGSNQYQFHEGKAQMKSNQITKNFPDSEDSLPSKKKSREVVQREVNTKEFEQAKSMKLQQVVEMEKTRMKFARELELQRMQFFMKTQMEIRRGENDREENDKISHICISSDNLSKSHLNNYFI
ncbi:hypothetical protein MANES_08G086011v8 [Manihot esculenta]|uniref:BHLH domain-containing protein n=1 Tax=Manihot esculenta TaxID=3983 RepID=A0A2C9VF61_MANES|nr:hypothetical protein MANES_08G086011v8 [Manihot esculenta]